MSAERFMRNGFTVFPGRGRRVAAVLAVAVLGAGAASMLMKTSADAPNRSVPAKAAVIAEIVRPAVDRAASVPDAKVPFAIAERFAHASASGIPLESIAAYAGRFPDLVRSDVFGLGRTRVAEMLARMPQPGLREPTFEETVAESYDLKDPEVLRFVDKARADVAISSRLVIAELAYQKKALETVYRIEVDSSNLPVLHAAMRFGTQAGLFVDLLSIGAQAVDGFVRRLPGGDFKIDHQVVKATGAGSGLELVQAFAGELAPDPAEAPSRPGPR